jgi:hypothetical protein
MDVDMDWKSMRNGVMKPIHCQQSRARGEGEFWAASDEGIEDTKGLDNLTWYYPNWDFGPISCPEYRPVRWSVNRASQIRVPEIRVQD